MKSRSDAVAVSEPRTARARDGSPHRTSQRSRRSARRYRLLGAEVAAAAGRQALRGADLRVELLTDAAENDDSTSRSIFSRRIKTLAELIEANAFSTLITLADGRPFATRMPFLYERAGGALHAARGAREPAVAGRRRPPREVLAVMFQGPHGYVSPTW